MAETMPHPMPLPSPAPQDLDDFIFRWESDLPSTSSR